MRTKLFALGAPLVAIMTAAVLVPAVAAAGGSEGPRYRVTVRALTDGQPLTPPVVVTHGADFDLFEVGQIASVGVKEVAENGNVPALATALAQSEGVDQVKTGSRPIVPSGLPGSEMFADSQTLVFRASADAAYLSFVSMLICTNDGITGVNGLALPDEVGETVRVGMAGYDAGTEVNTEDFADIVPPCQGLVGVSSGEAGSGVSNPALFENGVIHHHDGIAGGADLTSIHDWDTARPVARIVVTRIA
jgi:hypothetical protein